MINVGKVGMVPIESIIIGERAREILGDLDSTEENMRKIGLTTPLTLKDNHDGTFTLLAGERRYLILKRNENPEVPARIYDRELTELEMKIIEKSENFYRKDFEYYEYDRLVLDITTMEQELKGVKAPGPDSGTGHSFQDTGDMLGITKQSVSQAIKRAEARDAFPELFEHCKTQSDASKVLKRMDEIVVRQAIARKMEAENSDSPSKKLSDCYIVGDFFKGIKKTPNGVMHLVEIDPPYAIDLEYMKRSDGVSVYDFGQYNEIKAEHYLHGDPDGEWKGIYTLLSECYRVMAEHGWLIFWFAPEPWFHDIYTAIVKSGFQTTRMCGEWKKPTAQSKHPDIYLPNAYEMFFYAWKGRPAIAKPRHSNVFEYSPVPATSKTHPTERPVELTDDIYQTFAFPGSRVLIPFLGSGNGLISSHNLGMHGVGYELGKAYKDSFLVKIHDMR